MGIAHNFLLCMPTQFNICNNVAIMRTYQLLIHTHVSMNTLIGNCKWGCLIWHWIFIRRRSGSFMPCQVKYWHKHVSKSFLFWLNGSSQKRFNCRGCHEQSVTLAARFVDMRWTLSAVSYFMCIFDEVEITLITYVACFAILLYPPLLSICCFAGKINFCVTLLVTK